MALARRPSLILAFGLILALGLSVASPTAAVAAAPSEATYAALARIEQRVATIGFRLATANARWCAQTAPQFGWLWGDRLLYADDLWPAARAAYGVAHRAVGDDAPFIAAIAPGSPAALGGIAVGDRGVSVNGAPVAPVGGDAFARIAGLETTFAALPPAAAVQITTADGANRAVAPVAGCASDFRVEASDAPEASADGRLVLISTGLAQFAADDAELAAAMAHELAHNILRHPARLDAAAVKRGLLRQFGRNARLFRQTEVEADRLSVWLLAGSGYDPAAAARFWERFGGRNGAVLFQAGTHPRWRDRVATIRQEIAVLRAARLADPAAQPPLIAAPPPLE